MRNPIAPSRNLTSSSDDDVGRWTTSLPLRGNGKKTAPWEPLVQATRLRTCASMAFQLACDRDRDSDREKCILGASWVPKPGFWIESPCWTYDRKDHDEQTKP